MIVVSDASPLIALAAVRQFDVLRALYGEVLIPEAVYEEVAVRGVGEPGSREVQARPWVRVEAASAPPPSLLKQLYLGEAEAITLATARSADWVLMDERRGRKAAEALGLRVIGTVGVLVEASRRHLIPDLALVLDALRASGFHVSDALVAQALSAYRRL